MNRGKRGELTSSEIITIVLAIAGFFIVLVFLILLYGGTEGEEAKEVCRLSVLARATAPTEVQAAVPLKCGTEKICVSQSGKKDACPQFIGESNVRGVKLDGKTPGANARIIEQTSAEAMYQCWSMMGKGKLDLFGKAIDSIGGGGRNPTCVICSRVAYASDDTTSQALALVNLERYLENEVVPTPGVSQTYLEMFTDKGTKTFASLSRGAASFKLSSGAGQLTSASDSNRQIAFVFSQVKTPTPGEVLENLGYLALGGAFAVSKVPGSGALVTTSAGLAMVAVGAGTTAGVAAWSAYGGQQAAAGYCGQFTTSEEKADLKGGCSLVRGVDYNVADINMLCTSIQGDP